MIVDHSNLRRVILESATQFREGSNAAAAVKAGGPFDMLMLSGMGGSALPGNLLRIYLHDRAAHAKGQQRQLAIYQNRFYALPPEAFRRCLNIFCSHSGNTEETIAAFEEAIAHHLPCVGISSGGKIERMCAERGIPHVKLPIPYENFQPRMATGHFLGAIVRVLENAGMITYCISSMDAVAAKLTEAIPRMEERGKAIAERLKGKTPVIYSSTRFKALAMIWKIKINENAKTPAFWNFFPELNHNELVGFTNPQGAFRALMIRDPHDHPQNIKRYDVTAKLLSEKGIETEVIDMEEGETLYRMFATLALGDWTSYYLALSYGQDPTPVDMVEDLKKML